MHSDKLTGIDTDKVDDDNIDDANGGDDEHNDAEDDENNPDAEDDDEFYKEFLYEAGKSTRGNCKVL